MDNSLTQQLYRYVITYILWVIFALVALVMIFWTHGIIIDLVFGHVNPWQLRSIKNFGWVFLGLAWLLVVIGSEWYFHPCVKPKYPFKRLSKIFIIEISLFILTGAIFLYNHPI